MNYSCGRKGNGGQNDHFVFCGHFLHLVQDYRKRQTHQRMGWLQVDMEENRKIPEIHDLAVLKTKTKQNLNDNIKLQEKLFKGMTYKRDVKILEQINVPEDKYQIKDMMLRKPYQWFKYFRAELIFKKSFLPTSFFKLNVPTINQRQVLVSRRQKKCNKCEDQISKITVCYGGGVITCIWK